MNKQEREHIEEQHEKSPLEVAQEELERYQKTLEQIDLMNKTQLVDLRVCIENTLSSLSSFNIELSKMSTVSGFLDKIKRRNAINMARQSQERIRVLEDELLKLKRVISEKIEHIYQVEMKDLDKRLVDSITRGESVLICGISDESVIDFLGYRGLLGRFDIIDADSFLTMPRELLAEKKRIIITHADLDDSELSKKLWERRGVEAEKNREEMRGNNSIIIAESGTEKQAYDYHSATDNWTNNLFANVE